jgi:hypothetical protein
MNNSIEKIELKIKKRLDSINNKNTIEFNTIFANIKNLLSNYSLSSNITWLTK